MNIDLTRQDCIGDGRGTRHRPSHRRGTGALRRQDRRQRYQPGCVRACAAQIQAADGLAWRNASAAAFHADVSNKHAVQAMLDGVLDKWGRLDILVNNAGVEPHVSLLTLDEWIGVARLT